jgi:Cu/Ag efflux protein CusF
MLVAAPLVVTPILAGGCVSTTLELAANHPARPGAAAGVSSEPAAVLLPDAALDRSAPAAVAEIAQAQEPDGTRENPFVGRGVVRDVAEGALVIRHESIPGFMGAMTMAYPVAEGVDVGNLETGDAVTFRIELPESGGYRIFGVEAIEPEGETHDHAAPEPAPPPANPGLQR